jgi:hypothetical protein
VRGGPSPPALVLTFEISDSAPRLLSGLLLSITLSILGVLIPNTANRTIRPHNSAKLIAECIARHHLAFVAFFAALLVATESQAQWWRGVAVIAAAIAFGLYVLGILANAVQDRALIDDHGCDASARGRCTQRISINVFFHMMPFPIVLVSIAVLLTAVFLAVTFN